MKFLYKKFLTACMLLFALSSCSSPPPPATVKGPGFTVLSQGQQSGLTIQKTLILESNKEFTQLWTIHTGSSQTPMPVINFSDSVVVANFLGEQPTGGYSIKVDKVVDNEKYTQIFFSTQRPTPGSMRTMQFTQPYVMIKIDKTKKPIYFEYNR